MTTPLSRRTVLAAGATALGAAAPLTAVTQGAAPVAERKGRIKQSIVAWCFGLAGDKWDTEKMCLVAKQLGVSSIELAEPAAWPTIKKHGLTCAIAPNGMPGAPFMKGLNNPRYQEEVIARTTEMIDACAAAGFPAVIAFTGFKWRDADDPQSGEISLEEGADMTSRVSSAGVRAARGSAAVSSASVRRRLCASKSEMSMARKRTPPKVLQIVSSNNSRLPSPPFRRRRDISTRSRRQAMPPASTPQRVPGRHPARRP